MDDSNWVGMTIGTLLAIAVLFAPFVTAFIADQREIDRKRRAGTIDRRRPF